MANVGCIGPEDGTVMQARRVPSEREKIAACMLTFASRHCTTEPTEQHQRDVRQVLVTPLGDFTEIC